MMRCAAVITAFGGHRTRRSIAHVASNAGSRPTATRAHAHEAAEVGRPLHDFNIEFEAPTPGPEVLSERLTTRLAGDTMFAVPAGRPAFAVALVSVGPSVWYAG